MRMFLYELLVLHTRHFTTRAERVATAIIEMEVHLDLRCVQSSPPRAFVCAARRWDLTWVPRAAQRHR